MTTLNFISRSSFATLALTAVLVCGCTKPKQTTAIGSATGGAIGAGLGAIVGNQTGSTGTGMVLGAVTGAAAGSLIGNALQAQQESLRSQDESIERQERLLRAQRSEMDELRNLNSDTPSAARTNSSYRSSSMRPALSAEASRKLAELEKRGPNPRGTNNLYAYVPPSRPAPLRVNSEPLARFDVQSSITPARKMEPSLTAPKRVEKPLASSTTGVKNGTVVVETRTTETRVTDSTLEESDLPVELSATETARLANEPVTSTACQEATGEQQAAQSAAESSQKLYHLRRALRLCPNNASFHSEIGQVYLSMERFSEASVEFKQALAVNPNFQAAKNGLKDIESTSSEKF